MKFRAHDTFAIRKGWLHKGMRHVVNNPRIFGAAISYDLTNHQLHYSTDHRMSENALVFNLNNYFICEETIPDCVFDSLINNIKLAKEFN